MVRSHEIRDKWNFEKKADVDGNVTVYEARLVAKSFSQVQGVDYDETFSPVAKLKSVLIMLAIAAFYDYEIWQMDIKTAFLNGFLKKSCIWCNQKVFSIQKVLTKCASSSDPSMDWCKPLGVGIYALIV